MDEILNEIDILKESGKIVIVEGKKDAAALNRLGIINIKSLSRRPLVLIAEEVANEAKECVLLVDLDPEGKKLYAKLNHHLQQMGVRVDDRFRNFLYRNTKLRCIEGLDTYVSNIENKEK
jgi:5S rRNA maturation endonuclease (ribonuclease M5)